MVMFKIISKSSLVLAASPETKWGIARKGRDRIDGRILDGINSVEPQIIMTIMIFILLFCLLCFFFTPELYPLSNHQMYNILRTPYGVL